MTDVQVEPARAQQMVTGPVSTAVCAHPGCGRALRLVPHEPSDEFIWVDRDGRCRVDDLEALPVDAHQVLAALGHWVRHDKNCPDWVGAAHADLSVMVDLGGRPWAHTHHATDMTPLRVVVPDCGDTPPRLRPSGWYDRTSGERIADITWSTP